MRQIRILFGILFAVGVANAATIPPIILTPVKSTVFNITQSADLWYFNGESPSNYSSSIILNTGGPTQGTFLWTAVANPSAVVLGNPGNAQPSFTVQNNGNLLLIGAGISRSGQDVGIDLNYNGNDVGIYNLTVYAPTSAQLVGNIQNISTGSFLFPDSGYYSLGVFQTLDQFGAPIPNPLSENEFFATPTNVISNNWSSSLNVPTSWTTSLSLPSYFQDKWSVWGPGWTPSPQTPGNPLSAQEVFNVPQTYNAGSLASGQGRTFNTQLLHYYLDHALPTQ